MKLLPIYSNYRYFFLTLTYLNIYAGIITTWIVILCTTDALLLWINIWSLQEVCIIHIVIEMYKKYLFYEITYENVRNII